MGEILLQSHGLLEVQKLERDLPQVASDFRFYYKAYFNSALVGRLKKKKKLIRMRPETC